MPLSSFGIDSSLYPQEKISGLIEALLKAESKFIAADDPKDIYQNMLESFLSLTQSSYGVIYELCQGKDEQKYLLARALSDISWDDESRALYEKFKADEFIFNNWKSLLGAVVETGFPVVSNDPSHDPRSAGIPPGHPPLLRFLGLPLCSGGQFIGIVGLANSPVDYDEKIIKYLSPLLTTCANIAKANQLEIARKKMEMELRDLNKDLDSFTYTAAHDLRAPLRAISGFSKVLLEDYENKLDVEGKDMLHRIVDNAQLMWNLIDDLLHLAKIASSAMVLKRISMDKLAIEYIDQLRSLDPDRNVQFRCEKNLFVKGDPTLISLLIQNLLSNAWKYTSKREDAIIEMGFTAQDPSQPIFYVRDNGIGFDMKYYDNMFKPFYRLNPAQEYPGSGVGLAIARRILQRHGGSLWAESVPGQGAVFYFQFPKRSASRSYGNLVDGLE